jgi:hypothetical protein
VEATWYSELLFLGALVSRVSAKKKRARDGKQTGYWGSVQTFKKRNFSPEWRSGNAVLKGKKHGRILGVVLS